MFRPANDNRTAPTLVACFPNGMDRALNLILDDIYADTDGSVTVVGAMMLLIVRSANLRDGTNDILRGNCRNMFVGTQYTDAMNVDRFPADNATVSADADTRRLQELMTGNVGNAIGWITDLVNAYKKKPLEEKNVIGYFASIGFECSRAQKVARFINMVGPFFPDMIADLAFRRTLVQNVWTDYRLARCSTGKVLHENMAALRTLGIVTDPIAAQITAANDAPWDVNLANQIPRSVVAFCYIYLEAAGRGIDKWYQGEKAVANLSAAKARAAKVIFRKYLDASNNTEAVEAADTAQEVITAIPNGFFA
jgi:hypothetical protein